MICFISAPVSVDIQAVTDALALEGVTHVDARSLSSSAPWTETIRDAIAASDLAIVVLPEREPDPPAFMIEVGLALGMGKRLLVLLPKNRRPPAALSDVQWVRADLDDADAIRLNVRAALKDIGASPSDRETPRSRPEHELAFWLASTLAELPTEPLAGGEALEQLVADLFQRSGGHVERSRSPEEGPDLAVLLDPPSPVAGALLIEAKRIRGKSDLRSAMLQVQRYVLERGAALGVVAYLNVGRPIYRPSSVPRTVAIDLSELPKRLATQSLAEILGTERNRAVHET